MTRVPDAPTQSGATWGRRAFWMAPLTVVGFVAGMLVGEGLASAFGYPDPPPALWWVTLIAGGLGTLVVLAAPVTGFRVRRDRHSPR